MNKNESLLEQKNIVDKDRESNLFDLLYFKKGLRSLKLIDSNIGIFWSKDFEVNEVWNLTKTMNSSLVPLTSKHNQVSTMYRCLPSDGFWFPLILNLGKYDAPTIWRVYGFEWVRLKPPNYK